jgi:hypothetical protein
MRAVDRFSRVCQRFYPTRQAESLAASCSHVYKLFESGVYDSPFFASLTSELPGEGLSDLPGSLLVVLLQLLPHVLRTYSP